MTSTFSFLGGALILIGGLVGEITAADLPPVDRLPANQSTSGKSATGKIQFPQPVPPPPRVESSVNALTNLPLKLVVPGVFELGSVTLNNRERTVTFPCVVNMESGPLEYLLVTGWGKTHESVFRTDVQPFQIHVAMLLVDSSTPAEGNPATNKLSSPSPQFLSKPSSEELPGRRISIEVKWEKDGKAMSRPGGEFVVNTGEIGRPPVTEAVWIYNGSRVWDGRFMSQMVGSIVSLITDPDAQVNSITPGHDNDRIWSVNTNGLPAINTPVQMVFRLKDDKPGGRLEPKP